MNSSEVVSLVFLCLHWIHEHDHETVPWGILAVRSVRSDGPTHRRLFRLVCSPCIETVESSCVLPRKFSHLMYNYVRKYSSERFGPWHTTCSAVAFSAVLPAVGS